MRAGLYERISDDTEGLGLGVERQHEDNLALVARREGWMVAGTYRDNDLSAFSGKPRDKYDRLLEDVKAGLIDVIVAWHPDRLHRSPRELEDFIDLLEATEVKVSFVMAGDRDFSTPEGRWMARMEGANARRESEHKSDRITRKHRQLAEKGAHVAAGGRRPFGYHQVAKTPTARAGLKVNGPEARLIAEAARRVLAGESLYAICADWTARGVPTVTGAPWNTKTLRQILTSGRIAGWRDHHGEPLTRTEEWKPILDEPTWTAVRAILTDPSRKRTRVPRSYLLGPDLIRCGRCGGPLVASPQRDAAGELIPGYGCRKEKGGCGRLRVTALPVEELVSEWTLDALSDEERVAALSASEGDDTDRAQRAEIAGLETDLEELSADYYQRRLITRDEFLHNRDPLVHRLDVARAALAATTRRRPADLLAGITAVRKDWPRLGRDRQRALIGMVLESVTIAPAEPGANAFDPARVVPEYR